VLSVHRAERSDRLVDGLAGLLARSPGDPFSPEVIAVPSRGVERWLTQRLSSYLGTTPGRSDGVCANVAFPFPGILVGEALAAASGIDPAGDPWLPDHSVWPLLSAVDDNLGEDWLQVLAAHFGRSGASGSAGTGEPRTDRRFAAVRHLADLYDRYGVHRPGMIRAWAQGLDVDGNGEPLAADLAWQAALWRRLRDRIALPSPAERMTEACRRVRDDPRLLSLPGRVSLFGLTRLPASHIDVLMAIAASRDVHLWLLHPSWVLWDRLAAGPSPGSAVAPVSRRNDPTAGLPANPLLATWGRDAREMQLVLSAHTERSADEHLSVAGDAPTLLGRIQADVRADRAPPGAPSPGGADARPRLAPEDRSLQVHSCHGRARQVEVLRDAILHLLAEDPTLEPRHVIVMCPDIDSFAPLIYATFGLGRPEDDGGAGGGGVEPAEVGPSGRELRVRLADRSIRQTNPVLGALSQLLVLASSRLTASQVLDFAGAAPVRRRFGFDDAELVRVNEWVAAAGIRWGLDGGHRGAWLLPGLEAGTWESGLRRILLGVAMSEDDRRLVGQVLPIDDVDSSDIDLAGRFAEFVTRLGTAVEALSETQPVSRWVGAIRISADALLATSDRDQWQLLQLQALLDDLGREVGATPSGGGRGGPGPGATGPVAVSLAEVRSLLADRLRGRPTRASFRTGHLTMCTLVPMRSVPHRVVCLLGLDDGVFPRRGAPDGDDLLERDPSVGDRDARSEDRQLLLDALLAAEDHLVIIYSGRDERTNAVRPPAVPLGELLDVIDRTVRNDLLDPSGVALPSRQAIVTEHPLQPFDTRNFSYGTFVAGHPWSFDRVVLDGALASIGPRSARPAFLARPLSPAPSTTIEIDDLVRFVQHPVKAFLRQRLGVVVRDEAIEPMDGLSAEPDALERWAVGSRLLDGLLGGLDEEVCVAAEQARGALPPGLLGQRVLDGLMPTLRRLVTAAGPGTGDPEVSSIEVNIDLDGRRALVGTVRGVSGDTIRAVSFSRLGAKQRLTGWLRLLALSAAHPDRPWRAVTIGRGVGQRPMTASAGPLGDTVQQRRAVALTELRALIDLHDRGLIEPLPLYCATSAAWAEARVAGGSATEDAIRAWKTEPRGFPREDMDPAHQLVLGGSAPFGQILAWPAAPDECGVGWAAEEESRFGRLARRLWDPVLRYETLER
jgi:exodeoxyribonuclease V gamma subunit